MDINGKTIWQQAAGDTDRDYSQKCLEWDVILNGPGDKGRWPDCEKSLRDDKRSAKKITDIRRFAEEMKDGDLIVLRIGTSKVLAVGQVVGAYEWNDEFGDIDGWRLQHIRRVCWLWRDNNPKVFDTYDLKLGDTTQKLSEGKGPVRDWLSTLSIPDDALSQPLVKLPESIEKNDITVGEISEFLFDKGVESASIRDLLNEIGELTRIAKWYQRTEDNKPSEHETVAYLVVPLLRALGWTPQRMAVEWNHVDLALFEKLPRSNENLRVVVEAKKMENSCLKAKDQAEAYTNGRVNCHRVIVTDGLRYGVYTRTDAKPFELYAYMNLTRLRHGYPVYKCEGAEEALWAMTPEWKPK